MWQKDSLFWHLIYLQYLDIHYCRCSFLDRCICNLFFFELADAFQPAWHVQLLFNSLSGNTFLTKNWYKNSCSDFMSEWTRGILSNICDSGFLGIEDAEFWWGSIRKALKEQVEDAHFYWRVYTHDSFVWKGCPFHSPFAWSCVPKIRTQIRCCTSRQIVNFTNRLASCCQICYI